MSEAERAKLRPLIAAWSDGQGQNQATALADEYRDLVPRRITSAQLYGLQQVVHAAKNLEQVKKFIQHQGKRAKDAGRLDVAEYWDGLHRTIEGLGEQAVELAIQGGMVLETTQSKRKSASRVPAWLALWLAQDFVQHLVAHSLYVVAMSKGGSGSERRSSIAQQSGR